MDVITLPISCVLVKRCFPHSSLHLFVHLCILFSTPSRNLIDLLCCVYLLMGEMSDCSEHIEAHTHPYRCTISQQCSLTFSRISNLNRHRETKHGSLVVGKQKLKTEDVLEMGGIHHRIRRFESLTQLRRLLEALGFTCCDS